MSILRSQVKQKRYLAWINKILYADTTWLQSAELDDWKMLNQLFLNKNEKVQGHMYKKK